MQIIFGGVEMETTQCVGHKGQYGNIDHADWVSSILLVDMMHGLFNAMGKY